MGESEDRTWCFFDLDGTLILRDSYIPFLIGWLSAHPDRLFYVILIPIYYAYYLLAHKDRSFIKEALLTSFMKGAKREDINVYVKSFWAKFLPKHQNTPVVDRLKRHHKNGHRVFVVTGAFDFYADYLSSVWPLNGIIATKAKWKNDALTGKISGENCRGVEKVKRIEDELGINFRKAKCHAYTDSKVDLPFLKSVKYPMLVNSGQIIPYKK
jgi:HAD superfamily hydrolase (TIGR01490 family)